MLKEKNAVTIMDAACGTGVDSVMLIEEMGNNPGFHLTSCDFSDKMLKDALKTRWDRRREKPFFDWVIEEGNWLTLKKDVPVPGFGFDPSSAWATLSQTLWTRKEILGTKRLP